MPLCLFRAAGGHLGQVYEQFLGKVIRLTEGHRAVVEEKPEVKKAGGVYYTPTYIVEYIVRQTVGKLLDEATGSARAPRAAVGALADGSVSDAAEGLREGAQTDARGGRAPRDTRSASAYSTAFPNSASSTPLAAAARFCWARTNSYSNGISTSTFDF